MKNGSYVRPMKEEKENRFSDSDRILPRFQKINRSRIVKCLIMAVIIYLAFCYDLTWHQGSEKVNIYDRVIGILPGYGLLGNLFTIGLAMILYMSFTRFGDSVLFQSKAVFSIAVVFGLLNAGAWQMFYRDSLPGSAKGFFLFLVQTGC